MTNKITNLSVHICWICKCTSLLYRRLSQLEFFENVQWAPVSIKNKLVQIFWSPESYQHSMSIWGNFISGWYKSHRSTRHSLKYIVKFMHIHILIVHLHCFISGKRRAVDKKPDKCAYLIRYPSLSCQRHFCQRRSMLYQLSDKPLRCITARPKNVIKQQCERNDSEKEKTVCP